MWGDIEDNQTPTIPKSNIEQPWCLSLTEHELVSSAAAVSGRPSQHISPT